MPQLGSLKSSPPPIARGQHYREVQLSMFGRPGPEWIVEALFTGIDGIGHASLMRASDHSQRKTLSLAVLNERRRFTPIPGGTPAGEPTTTPALV